jgi:hypothetical protein
MSSGNPEKQQKVDGGRDESLLISLQLGVCVKVEAPRRQRLDSLRNVGLGQSENPNTIRHSAGPVCATAGLWEPEKAGIEL